MVEHLGAILQAVLVGVRIVGITAPLQDLLPVEQAVVVAVLVQRIGAPGVHLGPIPQAIAVGVEDRRIGAVDIDLVPVAQAVAVAVPVVGAADALTLGIQQGVGHRVLAKDVKAELTADGPGARLVKLQLPVDPHPDAGGAVVQLYVVGAVELPASPAKAVARGHQAGAAGLLPEIGVLGRTLDPHHAQAHRALAQARCVLVLLFPRPDHPVCAALHAIAGLVADQKADDVVVPRCGGGHLELDGPALGRQVGQVDTGGRVLALFDRAGIGADGPGRVAVVAKVRRQNLVELQGEGAVHALPTILDLTGRRAAVSAGLVAVITGLARVDYAIATCGIRHGEREHCQEHFDLPCSSITPTQRQAEC